MDEQKYEALKLKNQLCFPLYACAREMVKLYKPFLDEIGLTYTQYITLMVLWEEKALTVKALGKRLYLDSGTLTPLLKKLEEKGLVSRRRSQEDERNLIVTITEQGEALQERAISIPGRMAEYVLLEPEERRAAYRLLYKMLSWVDQNTQKE